MDMFKNLGKIKNIRIKLPILAGLALLLMYLVYGVIANLVVWLSQPDFVLPNGSTTTSLGFLVQLIIYSFLLLVFLAVTAFLTIFFLHPKFRKTEDVPNTIEQ